MGATTAAVTGIITALAAVGSAAYSMSQTSAGYDEPTPPTPEPVPTPEEAKEPEAKVIRDEERRKLMARRYLSGTVLSQPLGRVSEGKTLLGQ